MIRVFLNDGTHEDLPDNAPALPETAFDTQAEADAWVAKHEGDRRAWHSLMFVADRRVWLLRDGKASLVRVEPWRDAARRLTAERDDARREQIAEREARDAAGRCWMHVVGERDAEKARADAAEKRFADLRAWADSEATRQDAFVKREYAAGLHVNANRWAGNVESLRAVIRRIDGKERARR